MHFHPRGCNEVSECVCVSWWSLRLRVPPFRRQGNETGQELCNKTILLYHTTIIIIILPAFCIWIDSLYVFFLKLQEVKAIYSALQKRHFSEQVKQSDDFKGQFYVHAFMGNLLYLYSRRQRKSNISLSTSLSALRIFEQWTYSQR